MADKNRARNILIIGGSGFLSGTLARQGLAQGHQIWTLTRGKLSLPEGVHPLIADRHDPAAFAAAITGAGRSWDLVVDCIAFNPADIARDLAAVRERTPHFIFISTDFVYDPLRRRLPQATGDAHYVSQGYGAAKRQAELALMRADRGEMNWTILRPCHIYGPGSLLGCLPQHSRDPQLLARLQGSEALQLVGGGYFLQQPILAADLARLILSLIGNESTYQAVFNAAGPDIVESRHFYQIIADLLQVRLTIEEIPVSQYRAAHPEAAAFLCHRIYDMTPLAGTDLNSAGVCLPATPLGEGLRQHVESLLADA
jgi:nucleoside-diphosphate-sugar epimerase